MSAELESLAERFTPGEADTERGGSARAGERD
jgi:hypothetical protein